MNCLAQLALLVYRLSEATDQRFFCFNVLVAGLSEIYYMTKIGHLILKQHTKLPELTLTCRSISAKWVWIHCALKKVVKIRTSRDCRYPSCGSQSSEEMRWLFLMQRMLVSFHRGKICRITVIRPKALWTSSMISVSLTSYTHKRATY